MEDVKSITVVALEDFDYKNQKITKGTTFEIDPDDYKPYLDNQFIVLEKGVK